jgi:hypothetical protein
LFGVLERLHAQGFGGRLYGPASGNLLAVVWASTEQLALDSSNPLLRTFPAARDDGATPAVTTMHETTANRTDEAEDTRPEVAAFDAMFVRRAAPENMVGNTIYLDVSSINGDSDAILHVTQKWNLGGARVPTTTIS